MSSGRDRRAVALAAIAVLSALAACKSGSPPAGTDEVAGSAGTGSGAPAPTTTLHVGSNVVTFDEPKLELPEQESFTLLDAGTGARAALRYALAEGTTRFIAQA